jgi:hypothetical protein
MAKISKYPAIFSFLVVFFLTIPAKAWAFSCAGPLVPCGIGDQNPCKPCHFFEGFANLTKFIVFCLTPPAAVLMILISAFFLVFGGNESARTAGKKIFTNTIIGLVIVYASWVIINTIIIVFATGVEGWNPQGWFTFTCD